MRTKAEFNLRNVVLNRNSSMNNYKKSVVLLLDRCHELPLRSSVSNSAAVTQSADSLRINYPSLDFVTLLSVSRPRLQWRPYYEYFSFSRQKITIISNSLCPLFPASWPYIIFAKSYDCICPNHSFICSSFNRCRVKCNFWLCVLIKEFISRFSATASQCSEQGQRQYPK
jgi:hypothetical protein